MQDDEGKWSDLRLRLKEALWSDLASQSWSALSLDSAADDLLIDRAEAKLAAISKTDLVLETLTELDREALTGSHQDFSEDPDATIHDKLLEGLIHRFETYQAYKTQIRHLHDGALRDPKLGLKLIAGLSKSMDQLLYICGDTKGGAQRQLRVKGLTGLVMSVRSDWLDDDSSDLSKTTKILDKRLKQAAEWAETFRII